MVETEDLSVYGARIKGDCETYISLMENKHRAEGREMRDQEILVIDSIDGAEHLKSKSSVTSLISYSSLLFPQDWIIRRSLQPETV